MVIYASTKREAVKIETAMNALTGYIPSIFRDGRSYRIQDDNYGAMWAEALQNALAAGIKPADCSREIVGNYHPDYPEDWPQGWTPEQKAAALLGRRGGLKGGLSTSPAKQAASRANGCKGGRPRKQA